MAQRQAVLTVRLLIENDQTVDDAEEIVADALSDAELVAHVLGERIEIVNEE